MNQTSTNAQVDVINDTSSALMLINVEVALTDSTVYPVTFTPTGSDGQKYSAFTINSADPNCENDGFEVVFKNLNGDEGEVRFNFQLNGNWQFQTEPFTAKGDTNNLRWGWTKPGCTNEAYIDAFNFDAQEWQSNFNLQLIDPSNQNQTVDPVLVGRRG